jgi:hypothetical protein
MKDERTETWNPYTQPDRVQTPDWRPVYETAAPEQPARFEPRPSWIDPADFVRPRFR